MIAEGYNWWRGFTCSSQVNDGRSSITHGMHYLCHMRLLELLFLLSWKQVISQKAIIEVYWEELQLSALVLSYAPKSEQGWSYRRWLIRLIVNVNTNSKEPLMILDRRFLFHELIQQPGFHYSETSSAIDSDIGPKKEAPRDGYSHQQIHAFLDERV